ncbi:MAG: hybrid sensor histidine kinase/response regulator [Verrucomicrobia bacterium]|nr:hybrid sensor histidine kinase/response regulator [Verrucomicrobiota bacterium]
MNGDLSSFSMRELFLAESETQCRILSDCLVALEIRPGDPLLLESLMRAAHSLKGAARIIELEGAVLVAHAMEDAFVAAQKGEVVLGSSAIDRLLRGVDLLSRLASAESPAEIQDEVEVFVAGAAAPDEASAAPVAAAPAAESAAPTVKAEDDSRSLRVAAESLDQLLGSAGESLVASRRICAFSNDFWRLHRHQRKTAATLENTIASASGGGDVTSSLQQLQTMIESGDRLVLTGLAEFERFERNAAQLSQRLYGQALACRMRPFGAIVSSLRRAARDTARCLGREVSFEVRGEGTDVDRDLLDSIESPLLHLVRNAIDHGIESPQERTAAGKPAAGRLVIEASHSAGFLVIRVSDDGRGVDPADLRSRVVAKGLTDAGTAEKLAVGELLEFLFLPGFSLRSEVTEISGRGVGLDVVQSAVRESRGTVRISSEPGQGTAFLLQLPISLSVMKALVFEIAGEPYAIPLARVDRVLRVLAGDIESIEGAQYIHIDQSRVGIVDGAAVLGRPVDRDGHEEVNVLLLSSADGHFGIVVSRFIGEGEIVVQPLDKRLGRVRDIAATALTEDGSPMLLVDVEDFLLSVRRLAAGGQIHGIAAKSAGPEKAARQILVVDDSLTVRELERKLLSSLGYAVEVAVDGMDAWNAARTGRFAAVVTDVDMPRMDGIELTRLIKNDARLRDTPVIIVSYKDREEDRLRGLDAGADYYLTKGSFQDEGLARAVADVLGEESTP